MDLNQWNPSPNRWSKSNQKLSVHCLVSVLALGTRSDLPIWCLNWLMTIVTVRSLHLYHHLTFLWIWDLQWPLGITCSWAHACKRWCLWRCSTNISYQVRWKPKGCSDPGSQVPWNQAMCMDSSQWVIYYINYCSTVSLYLLSAVQWYANSSSGGLQNPRGSATDRHGWDSPFCCGSRLLCWRDRQRILCKSLQDRVLWLWWALCLCLWNNVRVHPTHHQPAVTVAESSVWHDPSCYFSLWDTNWRCCLSAHWWTIQSWDDLSSPHLSPTMAVLYNICCHNWMPTMNKTALHKDRATFVYMVANNKLFNFGKMVYDQIIVYANAHPFYRLVLPNLIDQLLCFQLIVPSYPSDHSSATHLTF